MAHGRRRAVVVAAVVAFALALGGCDWFYQSTFPSYVPLIQNQVDVSDRFPYDPAGEFRVEVMNGGTGDYIVVFSAGPQLGERVAIYDENLEEEFFRDGGTAPVGFSFNSPTVADNLGKLYVGNLAFTIAPDFSGPTPVTNVLNSKESIYQPGGPNYVSMNPTFSDNVDYAFASPIDASGGVALGQITGVVGPTFERIDSATDFQANVVGVVAFDNTNGTVAGLVETLAGFSLPNPWTSSTGGFNFSVETTNVRILQVTADGVVLEKEEGDQRLVFYDLAGNEGDSLDISSRGDTAYDFSAAGTHFYLLLADEGKLIKANTWW